MICPYCCYPVLRADDFRWYGRHKVHSRCQKWHEQNGLPYLLSGGEMQHRDHTISPRAANALIGLYARRIRELRRKGEICP
jgi:hypothetical protein